MEQEQASGLAVTAAEARGAAEGYLSPIPPLPLSCTQQQQSLDVRVAMCPLDDWDQIF